MDRNEGNKERGGTNTGNQGSGDSGSGNAYEDEKRDVARQGGQPTSYGEGNQGKMGQDDQSGGDGDQSGNRGGQAQDNRGGSNR